MTDLMLTQITDTELDTTGLYIYKSIYLVVKIVKDKCCGCGVE